MFEIMPFSGRLYEPRGAGLDAIPTDGFHYLRITRPRQNGRKELEVKG